MDKNSENKKISLDDQEKLQKIANATSIQKIQSKSNIDNSVKGSKEDSIISINQEDIQPIQKPSKNLKAIQILKENLYCNINWEKEKILEFRRKKVIKSRVSKYYELFRTQNYNKNPNYFQKENKVVQPKVKVIESRLVKKIRKSAIVKRILNFWVDKNQHYPSVFKKIKKVNTSQNHYYEETSDLTKKQFKPGEEPDQMKNNQILSQINQKFYVIQFVVLMLQIILKVFIAEK